MRSYGGLTDHDFELLVADLFSTEEGVRYEVFARGPDLGVDLRRRDRTGLLHIVQCKHYLKSALPQLRSAAKAEAKKLAGLKPAPGSYRFVTSRSLTAANKRGLMKDLAPFIGAEEDIWGEDDLELLLARHPEVERRHIKLWLPSSAQLQAFVHSAIHSRSRALVEEVNEDLPLWVPSDAFHEARSMLREQRVCVIAGVPGIGKTTLARMLVADAMSDGYEPMHVSGDVDDAWKMFSPKSKQIFYYDDFLGRTALSAQLGKNEEDRLLQFIRKISNSKTAMFVLTTREYILQQAKQLYEHLGREHSQEHRFLLELKHYSRLHRARIFYNHAFISEQLSKAARVGLLERKGYAAIIDHPMYNPRQIEWITGMSGHQLSARDNQDYVAFAVSALNNPELLWRHAFESHLNDAQRALLMTLVTMPDRAEVEDLKCAFGAHCKASGIAAPGKTFDRALQVLDNSFVETAHDEGHIFITASNPGIEDFLVGYLRASEDGSVRVLQGAVFFEQVQKLARVMKIRLATSANVAGVFLDAAERCFPAASCSWWEVYFGRDAVKPTTTRRRQVLEERAELASAVVRWAGPFSQGLLMDRAEALSILGRDAVVRQWQRGDGDKHAALRFLRQMRDEGGVPSGVLVAAKALFTHDLSYPYAFSLLADFRSDWGSAFDAAEWFLLGAAFEEVTGKLLSDPYDLGSVDDVDEIERYAKQMDATVDSELLGEARSIVEERVAEATQRAFEQSGDSGSIGREKLNEENTNSEIDALFARLADQ
ncbi:MAG: hypothetical protein AAB011_05555 [Candidatus Eisenbacteria bacterium]